MFGQGGRSAPVGLLQTPVAQTDPALQRRMGLDGQLRSQSTAKPARLVTDRKTLQATSMATALHAADEETHGFLNDMVHCLVETHNRALFLGATESWPRFAAGSMFGKTPY